MTRKLAPTAGARSGEDLDDRDDEVETQKYCGIVLAIIVLGCGVVTALIITRQNRETR